jgi:hypothetical protein
MSKDFEIVKTVRGEMGSVLDVSRKERSSNGYQLLSFRLYKEFERKEGEPTTTTAWLNERHIDECHRLLEEAREAIKNEKERDLATRRGAR